MRTPTKRIPPIGRNTHTTKEPAGASSIPSWCSSSCDAHLPGLQKRVTEWHFGQFLEVLRNFFHICGFQVRTLPANPHYSGCFARETLNPVPPDFSPSWSPLLRRRLCADERSRQHDCRSASISDWHHHEISMLGRHRFREPTRIPVGASIISILTVLYAYGGYGIIYRRRTSKCYWYHLIETIRPLIVVHWGV